MFKRFQLLFTNWLFWIIYSWATRALFLACYYKKTYELGFSGFIKVYFHGLLLDISMASYIMALPLIIAIIYSVFKISKLYQFVKVYNIIIIIILSLIIIADIEMYKYWGFRLDNTALQYIATPFEMVASLSTIELIAQILVLLITIVLSVFLFKKYLNCFNKSVDKPKFYESVIYVVLGGVLFIGIRGGVSIAPINTGVAYYSNYQFANHAALNVPFNLGYSLDNIRKTKRVYNYYENSEAQLIFKTLFKSPKKVPVLLKSSRPNIIFILSESFTAKIVEPLGGLPDITPNFNKLCKEGVLFTQNYASSDRSDKGIVSSISGFPGLPQGSIMSFPTKSATLPFLSADLKDAGYNNHWYYGGDIDFANMRSFIINAGFDKITSDEDFSDSLKQSKWGVQDQTMYNCLFNDIATTSTPFFKFFFTLSCHEPFEIPTQQKFTNKGDDSHYLSAAYYTDSCLGDFINKAKKTTWWNNTLIVITADHGTQHPGGTEYYMFDKFHTPLLLLGGALKKDTIITAITSQIDLPLILLSQLNIEPKKPYIYSKNTLSSDVNKFAFYTFNDGFGFVTDSCKIVFDNISGNYIVPSIPCENNIVNYGKAFMQVYFTDFMNRK